MSICIWHTRIGTPRPFSYYRQHRPFVARIFEKIETMPGNYLLILAPFLTSTWAPIIGIGLMGAVFTTRSSKSILTGIREFNKIDRIGIINMSTAKNSKFFSLLLSFFGCTIFAADMNVRDQCQSDENNHNISKGHKRALSKVW